MPIQLAGNIKHGGLFETAFGVTLGELVDDIGGGTASGRPVKAVQVGGPLGAYFPRALFDTPFDYEAFAARDGLIGHGGVVVFDDTVDMAKQARFAFEFCAIESCGKCTPCRIGSTRGAETIDKIMAGEASRGQPRAGRGPLQHHEVRLAVRARRLHALPGHERAHAFPRGFPPTARRGCRPPSEDRHDTRSKRSTSARPPPRPTKTVTLTIDGTKVTVPEGTSIMRAAMEMGTQIPKLCATDSIEAFGSCRLCLVEIEGRDGTPASCTTPVADGLVVHTQIAAPEADPPRRDGALHLRPSARLPDLRRQRRLRAAGHGRRRRPARRALRLRGRQPRVRQAGRQGQRRLDAEGREQPLLHLRSLQVHRLQSLRARLRGGAGHLRADHLRPRLRQPRLARHVRELPRQRVRLLRRLRAGLPHRHADREGA